MRTRLFVSTVSVLLLLALLGMPTTRAQVQDLTHRGSLWEHRLVIEPPVDDDDEGDDECADRPAPVARTGQVIPYGARDDGELQKGVKWPDPRFTDNSDGTVTDRLTGLVWLADATRFSGQGWNPALNTCNNLAADGTLLDDGSVAGDWRLPNNKELRGLIDLGNSNPALPAGHPFTVPPGGVFWTSTTATNNTGRGWTIEDATMVNDPKNTPNLVWPVRDAFVPSLRPAPVAKTGQLISYGNRDDGELQKGVEWPAPRFTHNGDGTVTDELTGLIWLADVTGLPILSFDDALATCNALADDGFSLTDGSVAGDWRLPNIWELGSLNDFSQIGPALPVGHPFTVPNAGTYWSSSTADTNSNRAWTVGMGIGKVSSVPKNDQNQFWPVRGCDDEYDDEYYDDLEDMELLPDDDVGTTGSSEATFGLMKR